MGATLTVSESTNEMVRLVGDKLVQETSQPNLYTVPPKGEYAFQITGYALPFEMEKSADYGGGTQTMTRLELTITEGKGAGKMCSILLGYSLGQKSNLGRFLRQLNVDLTPVNGKWDLDWAIGYRGKGWLLPSDKLDDFGKPKYVRLALDLGYAPLGAPDQKYGITIETREPVGAAANGNAAATDDGWE